MTMAGRNMLRRRDVGGLVGLNLLLAASWFALWSHGLEYAADLTQMFAFQLDVLILIIAILRRKPSRPECDASAGIDDVKTGLAKELKRVWSKEASNWGLTDPDPIPVQWRAARTELVAHENSIESDSGVPGGPWTASSAEIATLANRVRRTRRKRLVILGGAGSGKTTLAVQLMLHLLKKPADDDPIPVLFSVAGWDPERELHEWLTEELNLDYPNLGTGTAQALIEGGHILPVLDGLDELPPSAQAKAVRALSELPEEDQLILTCRTAEFEGAVKDANRKLTSAAVIEPLPLCPAQAADYLESSSLRDPGECWQPVLNLLRATPPTDGSALDVAPGGPGRALAEVTATALGLWLLRSVYSAPGAEPSELTGFHDADALWAHLLDGLIPAMIATRRWSEDPSEHFRPGRRYDAKTVRESLEYLAHLQQKPETVEVHASIGGFAWWQLALRTLNPRTARLTVGLAVGLMVCVVGIVVWLAVGPTIWLVGISDRLGTALTGGLVVGLEVGVAGGLAGVFVGALRAPAWLKEVPGFANLTRRPRSFSILVKRVLGVWLVAGLAVWFVVGLMLWLVIGLRSGFTREPAGGFMAWLLVGLIVGGAGGLGAALVNGVIHWIETPTSADHVSTPLVTWRADRSLHLLRTIAGMSTTMLVIGLTGGILGAHTSTPMYGLPRALTSGLAFAFTFGVVGGLVAGLALGRHHAWLAYMVATYRLARRGQLPRRLMPFLDDMHRLGLLRAVGAIYQFRHAKLQNHLAATYSSADRYTASGPPS